MVYFWELITIFENLLAKIRKKSKFLHEEILNKMLTCWGFLKINTEIYRTDTAEYATASLVHKQNRETGVDFLSSLRK